MLRTGNHICAGCLWYKERFEEFGTNNHILTTIFKGEATQSVSMGSAVHLLLAPAQVSEQTPQAKGVAEADAKGWKPVEIWLSIPKASPSAAERVGADNKLTQKNKWWQPCSSAQEQLGAGTELCLSLAIWSLLCSWGSETMPCPSP